MAQMQIRSEQIQQMQVLMDTKFCGRICTELRTEIPAQVSRFGDLDLLRVVSDAVEKAKKYQVTGGDAVRRFVKLAVLISPQFDEIPDVQRFLRLPDLDPDAKIKLLCELTAQHLRAKGA
jgi:hypothetical protein